MRGVTGRNYATGCRAKQPANAAFPRSGAQYGAQMTLFTKDMSILDALERHPKAREVFESHGMTCCLCIGAQLESIESGAIMHAVDPDARDRRAQRAARGGVGGLAPPVRSHVAENELKASLPERRSRRRRHHRRFRDRQARRPRRPPHLRCRRHAPLAGRRAEAHLPGRLVCRRRRGRRPATARRASACMSSWSAGSSSPRSRATLEEQVRFEVESVAGIKVSRGERARGGCAHVSARDRAAQLVAGGLAALEAERGSHQRPERLSGARRRHRHQPLSHRPGGPRRARGRRRRRPRRDRRRRSPRARSWAPAATPASSSRRSCAAPATRSRRARRLDTAVVRQAPRRGLERRLSGRQAAGRGAPCSPSSAMMAEAVPTLPAGVAARRPAAVAAQAGKEAVEATPEQLEVLSRAGVVDAGGYGLLVLFEGDRPGAARPAACGATVVRTDRRRGRGRAATSSAVCPTTSTRPSATATARASCSATRLSIAATWSGSSPRRATAGWWSATRRCSRCTSTPTTPARCSAMRRRREPSSAVEVNDMREQIRGPQRRG